LSDTKTLLLYTTSACHICEDAKSMIWPLLPLMGYRLKEVEIADSDELLVRYGTRIPVVEREVSAAQLPEGVAVELQWPFTADQLIRFMDY
jgi:hypothetical protein